MSEPAGGRPLVVGVGASAGGLEAARDLLRGVHTGCGVAFVFVFHVDPAAPTLLPDILSKAGPFPAVEVADGTAVAPDRVYTAPAGVLVGLDDGVFRLAPAERPEDLRTPVDHFLHALARDQGERAVAVILSGTGSDGALGLRAVGDAGGMTLVQEPATARHDGMPQSALATGAADHVLPPDGLAAELVAYTRHVRRPAHGVPLAEQVAELLPAVCETLLRETGHDFRHYKTSTLVRRAVRRVQVLKLPTARDYLDRLRADRAEADQLFKDLLIGVTAFFRDPDAFGVLADEVLPRLVAEGGPNQPLRVWVPGCATGEEAYTIAMLVRERLDGLPAPPEVQVFATDIDERALAFARRGVYPLGVADEVGPERLGRFFVKKGPQYHVSKELRETVLFSVHNLINDPPFSRIDLISCRNLLIYLGSHLQQKLIPLFHYALRPGGYLFLGPSENLSGHQELFRPVDAKSRISQRLATAIRPAGGPPHARGGTPPAVRPPNATPPAETATYLLMQRIVLDEFAPKAAVVTEDGQVVCASGNLEKYLTVAAGAFHNEVTRLAREGLRAGLRAALAEAARVRRRVDHDGLSLRTEAGVQRVMVTVQPMPQMGEENGLFMVVFQDVGPVLPRGDGPGRAPAGDEAAALVEQLERELATTRQDLERAVQELEAANEELKSSNEELLSMNEELQSANEELEASKEEVEAANETLTGVNADLENLLASTRIATLFLDDAGNLRRVTPAAADIYNVVPSDVGRPLAHFTHKARRMPPLPAAADVRAADKPFEDEVETAGGTWYLRRVLPYRAAGGRVEGLVVTFIDITERKRFEDQLRASELLYRAIGESIDYGVWVCDPAGRTTYASESFLRLVGMTQEECSGTGWGAALHPDDAGRTVTAWKECVRTGGAWDIEHRFKGVDGAWHPILARGVPVKNEAGEVLFWAGINLDISAQRRAADALTHSVTRYGSLIAATSSVVWATDGDGAIVADAPSWEAFTGQSPAEYRGWGWLDAIHPDDREPTAAVWRKVLRERAVYETEYRLRRRDGEYRHVVARGAPVLDAAGGLREWVGTCTDIHDRKRTEADLLRVTAASDRQRRLYETVLSATPDFVYVFGLDHTVLYANDALIAMWGRGRDGAIGKTFLEIGYEPWHAAMHDREIDQVAATRQPVRGEVPFAGTHGRRVYEYIFVPVFGAAGEVEAVAGTTRDVTDRKAAEEALRDSERRFRETADTAPVALWLTDPDGACTFLSREWYEFTGQTEAEALGLGWTTATHPDDQEAAGRAFLDANTARTNFRTEYRLRTRSGAYRWAIDAGRPRFSAAGGYLGMVGAVFDIHDKRQAEEALRDADRRKDEFLATLAHELRNPLAPIRNGLRILQAKALQDDDRRRTLEIMVRQLGHLVHLVDDLLDVSRVSSGKITLRRQPVDLRQVVEAAVETARHGVEAAGHVLDVALPDGPLALDADPTRLAQVFANLLNNAAKYTDKGGRIGLTAARDGGEGVVSVRDTGIGIPADMLGKVFDMFTQVGPSLDRSQGGLGIGLTLVRRLVEMHGGTVAAASDGPGAGSTFTVRLPLAAGPLPAPVPVAADEAVVRPPCRRILVVDDNADAAESLAIILGFGGHEVRIAHAGPAALTAAASFRPDLVFLDIGLPGMDGYEVARRLRLVPGLERVVLVALTGWGSDGDRLKSSDAGFDHHLTKPVDAARLDALVARVGGIG